MTPHIFPPASPPPPVHPSVAAFKTLDHDQQARIVRRWAKLRGMTGREGGCIYRADGTLICQGWSKFQRRFWKDIEHDIVAGVLTFRAK